MAEARIHAALVARVESLSLSPALPVAYPGVPFADTAGSYIRVTHMRNRAERWALAGQDGLDRAGFLQLDLFTVIGADSWQVVADGIADSIIGHFPRDLVLTSGDVDVQIVAAWADMGRPDPNGMHWHTPVMVEYRATA